MIDPPDDVLSAYLDDELDDAARAAVDARLAVDPAWREELESIASVRHALRAAPSPVAPDGFWAAVTEQVVQTPIEASVTPLDPARRNSPRRSRPAWWWAGGAVAASFLLVGIVMVPERDEVEPVVPALAAVHSARAGETRDPLSPVAPVVVEAGLAGR